MPGLNWAFEQVAIGIMRSVMNSALRGTTESQLKDAIRDGTSLWKVSEGEIRAQASKIPPFVIAKGNEVVETIEKEHGGFTPLVIKWLEVDQPNYCSTIKNTPGGYIWLDTQVYDILRGIGMLKP